MPDRIHRGGVEIDVEAALTDLQQATDLLAEVDAASDYEQGNAFAIKSIAHSVLHLARGSGVIDPLSLRVLCVQWTRQASEIRNGGDFVSADVMLMCVAELRALLGDES
jgi:hypothetical protein